MKAVIQRAKSASVTIDGEIVSSINKGLVILLGVCEGDTEDEIDLLASKIANMRIFEDENGKMNISALQESLEILLISNFTLCADIKKGRRPSFVKAEKPEKAKEMYLKFGEKLENLGIKAVKYGQFGADMKVELINDGPVTIIADSDELK